MSIFTAAQKAQARQRLVASVTKELEEMGKLGIKTKDAAVRLQNGEFFAFFTEAIDNGYSVTETTDSIMEDAAFLTSIDN